MDGRSTMCGRDPARAVRVLVDARGPARAEPGGGGGEKHATHLARRVCPCTPFECAGKAWIRVLRELEATNTMESFAQLLARAERTGSSADVIALLRQARTHRVPATHNATVLKWGAHALSKCRAALGDELWSVYEQTPVRDAHVGAASDSEHRQCVQEV